MRIAKWLTIGTFILALCAFGFLAVNRIAQQSWFYSGPPDHLSLSITESDAEPEFDRIRVSELEPVIVDQESLEPQRAYFPGAIRASSADDSDFIDSSNTVDPADNQVGRLHQAGKKPQRVSPPKDVAPIASPTNADSLKRQVIERALPNSTQEERDIWFQELRGLDWTMIEEILQLRSRLGRIQSPRDRTSQPTFDESPTPPIADEPKTRVALSSKTTATFNAARTEVLKNIANVNAVAYKRTVVDLSEFGDNLVANSVHEQSHATDAGSTETMFSRIDISEGELRETGRTLDIAISGPGWFVVRDDETDCYTRAGTLRINARNEIVLWLGGKMLQFATPIVVPKDSLSIVISENGHVSAVRKSGNDSASTEIGAIQLARFLVPSDLKRRGDGTFLATSASGTAILGESNSDSFGRIRQGYLEKANTTLESELHAMEQLNAIEEALAIGISAINKSRRILVAPVLPATDSQPLAKRNQ